MSRWKNQMIKDNLETLWICCNDTFAKLAKILINNGISTSLKVMYFNQKPFFTDIEVQNVTGALLVMYNLYKKKV